MTRHLVLHVAPARCRAGAWRQTRLGLIMLDASKPCISARRWTPQLRWPACDFIGYYTNKICLTLCSPMSPCKLHYRLTLGLLHHNIVSRCDCVLQALYNIAKVARESFIVFFQDVFDALFRLCADAEPNVQDAAQFLDSLIKASL